MNRSLIIYLFAVLVLVGCTGDDSPNLPPAEERVSAAIGDLRSDLMAPSLGWRLEYQPTPTSGVFFMILQFDDKEVRIQSDVVANNGFFYDQTIPYRLDSALGLELILETYCVFAYLFEQDQATFGAEFEFIFKERSGENLIFESKTDLFNPTVLTFEPATSGDENAFSREIAENLDAFNTVSPQALTPESPQQQIILEDRGLSVFWALDPRTRNIVSQFAGEGTTVEEILTNGGILLNHSSGYGLFDGFLVLQNPLLFSIGGQNVTLDRIALENFDMNAPNICPTEPANGPRYRGSSAGNGEITMLSTLLTTDGQGFQENLYTVNSFFVFDGEGNSLTEGGVIGENFPDATGFIFIYGVQLNDPNIPVYSVGLILESGDIYVREFEPTFTEINRVRINLVNNFFHTGTPNPGDQQGLTEVTDEIFAGGEVYAFDFPVNGATVWRLFNPCNQYEVFLVE
jgi:hypothetical protein